MWARICLIWKMCSAQYTRFKPKSFHGIYIWGTKWPVKGDSQSQRRRSVRSAAVLFWKRRVNLWDVSKHPKDSIEETVSLVYLIRRAFWGEGAYLQYLLVSSPFNILFISILCECMQQASLTQNSNRTCFPVISPRSTLTSLPFNMVANHSEVPCSHPQESPFLPLSAQLPAQPSSATLHPVARLPPS